MNIIFLKNGKKAKTISLHEPKHLAVLTTIALFTIAALLTIGYKLGGHNTPKSYVAAWQEEIDIQKTELNQLNDYSNAHIDSLTSRVGQLQGHVTRMDALSTKLVKMADLDPTEFSFDQEPAIGGPANPNEEIVEKPDAWSLELAILDLNKQLDIRQNELTFLEDVMARRVLNEQVIPEGHPVKGGWISSHFGYRNSPFKGKRELHRGIDIAAKRGAEILSVAGGVVTRSGVGTGYGNIVEIDHGNGYKTKYAHNKANLVVEGQAVKKGEPIALLGSTGRSTGPHVHFEVIKDGVPVDPIKFIKSN